MSFAQTLHIEVLDGKGNHIKSQVNVLFSEVGDDMNAKEFTIINGGKVTYEVTKTYHNLNLLFKSLSFQDEQYIKAPNN